MSANFLGYNGSKTERRHGLNGRKENGLDFLSLAPYEQSIVTDLGVKLDVALKLDFQTNAVTRSYFFQL